MYWEREQEITLLQLVLETFDPTEYGSTSAVDAIVCGLIEMGLVCMDRAPVAQQAWQDEWEGLEVTRAFIVKHYVTPDERDDENGSGA